MLNQYEKVLHERNNSILDIIKYGQKSLLIKWCVQIFITTSFFDLHCRSIFAANVPQDVQDYKQPKSYWITEENIHKPKQMVTERDVSSKHFSSSQAKWFKILVFFFTSDTIGVGSSFVWGKESKLVFIFAMLMKRSGEVPYFPRKTNIDYLIFFLQREKYCSFANV